MIRSFNHRGLKGFYFRGTTRYLSADQLPRIRQILNLLDVAIEPSDLNITSLRLHRLKGKYNGFWSVRVSGNWRIIFRFESGDAYDVELVDYH